jgi:hypothetical protein
MDRGQLITITITAVITVAFKEVFTTLVAWAKIKATTDTTKQKAKKLFSPQNVSIAWHFLWLGSSLWLLVNHVRSSEPVTRGAVFAISLWTVMILLWVLILMLDLIEWQVKRKFATKGTISGEPR